MTVLQRIKLRLSEVRERLNTIAGLEGDAMTAEIRTEAGTLHSEYSDLEVRSRAAIVAEDVKASEPSDPEDAEVREVRKLRGLARVGAYLGAAMDMRAVDGAEAEYNAAVGAGAGFPLQLLAPEIRTTTNSDGQANQGSWVDRLFAVASASRVGVTFRSVAAGLASFPVTTAGATGQQQDRAENTGNAAWTVGTTECRPKRGSVRAVFTVEDAARMPGLEDALRRDLSMALMDSIDAAIFKGDAGPGTASYDIVGLQSAAGVERTLTQANKAKAVKVLEAFVSLVDGKHASGLGDLGIVASVGSNTLWHTTIANSAVDNETIAQFLMRAGLAWGVRANIDTNTSNGDYGAYIGRMRGIEGAAVAAIWEAGSLIRDPYSDAGKGEIALTLNYLWDFKIPRASNYARLKFVT